MSRQLDEKVLVSGQIRPEDVAALVGEGVTMLVNNRPDGEEPDQPLGMDIEKAARAAGIEYRAIPIIRGIGPADAQAMQDAIKAAKGKVFAFCRTGTRSSLAWALAKNDEGMSRGDIERHLSDVGVDPTPIAHLL
ncbi:TIGR01244 family phosphatase [Sphingomonas sediminicola]|uniref:TIGR01244 family phosphatase n=1 Tax=Sphingomonas sediminicola TaxID=386874 RepID=A0ABX6T8X9_9SPHN|nr:TIGR01244 family phosphatase [Sphingomonas sediminicola]